MALYVVGLDMSLTSPGVAVYNTQTHFWNLYAFAQRKSELHTHININQNATLHLFDCIPESKYAADAVRYKFIVDCIVPIIPLDSAVLLEAYAFPNRAIAGSNFKLHELGGVLKVRLLERGIRNVHSIVSSSWKKACTGSGKATKNEIVDFVLHNDPSIDLMKILNLKLSVNGEIPCPAQDLADAICITKSFDKYRLIIREENSKRKEKQQKGPKPKKKSRTGS